MANESVNSEALSPGWQAKQVYAMAVLCLIIGVAVGYLFRGSRSPISTAPTTASDQRPAAPSGMKGPAAGQHITLEQMKHMADKQSEPLLAKLKDDPKNADLMVQIANVYFAAHQFPDAINYLKQSLEIKPKNTAVRTELASCLFYNGDVDGSLQQLTQATTDDPKDANSLFNLGMVRLRGKKDSKGAQQAWAQLLKTNPQLEPAKKAQVEKLMADVRENKITE